ncbi:MAG: hypothetical protein HOC74_12325 [Gemmatimonadetes bacterium]|jgi:hypothetical protein|nr:hypothetical protein [Gemmatimonadota bacterium]
MQCEHIKTNGLQCRAHALRDGKLCYAHSDPEGIREAGRKGGQQVQLAILPADAPKISLKSAGDVLKALETILNQVLTGEVSARIGNAAGYLLSVFLRAHQQADIEKRIRDIEVQLKEDARNGLRVLSGEE